MVLGNPKKHTVYFPLLLIRSFLLLQVGLFVQLNSQASRQQVSLVLAVVIERTCTGAIIAL